MVHLRPLCWSQQSTNTLAVDRFRSCHSASDISEELASYGRGRVVSTPSVIVAVVSLESEPVRASVSFPELMNGGCVSFRAQKAVSREAVGVSIPSVCPVIHYCFSGSLSSHYSFALLYCLAEK